MNRACSSAPGSRSIATQPDGFSSGPGGTGNLPVLAGYQPANSRHDSIISSMGGFDLRQARFERPSFLTGLFSWLIAAAVVAVAQPIEVTLDGTKEGGVFEGIGCLSAGASSRLLIDYPEPYRSQVLDYLFRTNYGAGFQHLKVEVGGDVNSTDGCEPSHMRSRDDQNYERGLEWWLMKEARRRNPGIVLDCLQWGAPAWIGNGHFYSQDNADYLVRFLQGARRVHGLDIQYAGVWNEMRPDMGWIKLLRQTLDRNKLERVRIVAADEINRWSLVDVMRGDPELAAAIDVVGVHYPKFHSTPAARECGKPIWSSEDGPWKGNWFGASMLARMYNRNYVQGRMTKTIIWSPVTAYFDNLPLPGSGVMRANSPWSGHYEVQPALWATAHTTQFAQPGWKYLDGGACGALPDGGTCVVLKSTNGTDYSLIVETLDADERQDLNVRVTGGLSTGPLHVWRSDPREQFVRLDDVIPSDGRFVLSFDPGCIYSFTTTTGQSKGGAVPPPDMPFPGHYAEDFESYRPGSTPKYFSDQAGIFEVDRRTKGRGQSLHQVIDRKGIEWRHHLNPCPETFLGDPTWSDYEVSTDVLLEQEGFVSLFGRVVLVPQDANLPEGYWLKVNQRGDWELGTAAAALASGRVPFAAGAWHRLALRFAGDRIEVRIDGQSVREVSDATYVCGFAGLGCGWHPAQFDNFAVDVAPYDVNLARGKPARASSVMDFDSGPANATDGDAFTTRWIAASDRGPGEWLEVDLGGPTAFNTATLRPFEDRISLYRIQYRSGDEWRDAHVGNHLGALPQRVSFPTVTAARVRFFVISCRASPALAEFEVSNRPATVTDRTDAGGERP